MRVRSLAGLALVAVVIVGAPTFSGAAAEAAAWTAPPVNASADYQLGGDYTPPSGTTVVERDRSSKPLRGRYNICYINGFQTQASEASFWSKHQDLLLHDARGALVEDPNWPGEHILDTSTAAKRRAIAAIEYRWIDGCAKAGYQAVEPDNLDTWTRSGGRLTKAMNLALAKSLITRAHRAGLAIAQKNASELGTAGKRLGFDFVVAESCQVYAGCGDYQKVYGRHMIEIEYTTDGRRYFSAACTARGRAITILYRDQDLVAKGRSGYHYEAC